MRMYTIPTRPMRPYVRPEAPTHRPLLNADKD